MKKEDGNQFRNIVSLLLCEKRKELSEQFTFKTFFFAFIHSPEFQFFFFV